MAREISELRFQISMKPGAVRFCPVLPGFARFCPVLPGFLLGGAEGGKLSSTNFQENGKNQDPSFCPFQI
jgi:hypothetical protein